jgi:subtilisin family serine protease
MNKKLVTIAIVAMILMLTLPATSTQFSSTDYSVNMQIEIPPLQKIDSYLQDQMERSDASDEPLRILIRYDADAELMLPKGVEILTEFEIIPLISALASPFEIEELAKLKGVEYIYPDLKVQALNADPQQWLYPDYTKIKDLENAQLATEPVPDTPWFGEYPCFLNESTALIGADDLWTQDITGEGVTIAILDTGIYSLHPDLDDMDDDPTTCDPKVLAEEAFIEEPGWEVGDPMDYVGHGTHCASIAAGTGATGAMSYLGTYFGGQFFNATILPGAERGVAPGAYLYNVKVLNSGGWGYDSWIVAGIEWSMEHGADVISMSLGGWPIVPPDEDPLVLAMNTATEHGVVCVVAAGNSGWGYFSLDSPGFGPSVITVGATTETDELAAFSSRGPEQYELHAKPDIVAPGTCIVAAFYMFDVAEVEIGQQIFYVEMSGTSMATPHVAGAAALLLEAYPGATPYSVKSAMMLGADDLGMDPMAQGAGRLNVANARQAMVNAAKTAWNNPKPTNDVTPEQPTLMMTPNLTDKNILVEDYMSSYWEFSTYLSQLENAGANVDYLSDVLVGYPYYTTISEAYHLSSPHPYPSNTTLSYLITHPGANQMRVHFPKIVLNSSDYIYIYDKYGSLWYIFDWDHTEAPHYELGFYYDAWTNWINGDVINITLVSDSNDYTAWGFEVDTYEAQTFGRSFVDSTSVSSAHPYTDLRIFENYALESPHPYLDDTIDVTIESPHPYPDSYDHTWEITYDGAEYIGVHFSRISMEPCHDYIYVYDEYGSLWATYHDMDMTDVWCWIPGDTASIRLVSDESVNYWGFEIDKYRVTGSDTRELHVDNAQYIRVHFENITLDAGDYLDVYDAYGGWWSYYWNTTDVWTGWFTGDTVWMALYSGDWDGESSWGYKVDKCECIKRGAPVTFYEEGAAYVKLHFGNVTLEVGDYILVSDAYGYTWTYASNTTNVWTPAMQGDTVTIEIVVDGDNRTAWGFQVDQYLCGYVKPTAKLLSDYDAFLMLEPYYVDSTFLTNDTLYDYVTMYDGTILFTGDYPWAIMDYDVWTESFGITWNNTAVGGLSETMAPHAITSGITEIYFGSPITSLILNASVECVVWDPIFPGVAAWEAQTPSTGKVVAISDDGILNNQFLGAADNLRLGFNIIRWLTNASTMYQATGLGVVPLVPPIESPHPYPNDAYLEYPLHVPGASSISVHFSTIDVESGYDHLYILDEHYNTITVYSGYYSDIWTPQVPGDTVYILLTSDFMVTDWGFLADAYSTSIAGARALQTEFHEIGVGGTWEKYVVANSTFTMTVDVENFGNYTEDVMLTMALYNGTDDAIIEDWNFANVTVAPGQTTSVEVTSEVILNATTECDLTGIHNYDFVVSGDIYDSSSGSSPYQEIDYINNLFDGEIAAVPKTERSGQNPLLNVVTPMKIESTSAPLIAMYPNDFTLHNVTAFVGGGELVNAEFRISGTANIIADFVNVTTLTKHYGEYYWWDEEYVWIPDTSPAYFIPNMTAVIGDTLDLGNVSAPAMLSAELQVYIKDDTTVGTYTGTVELVNGTEILASASLEFEVRTPQSKVLWEDYFNDYQSGENGPTWGFDCERLWGGAWGGTGVFEWWKLVASAGFDVDSLHQQLHFNEHLTFWALDAKDPMQIIAYGGYDTMYMHDVEYPFFIQEITVFQGLYETGKMNFVVLFNYGSEEIDYFTTNYGISLTIPYGMGPTSYPYPMADMLVTGVDKTHPIFEDVENFTLSMYPYEDGYFLRAGSFIWGEEFIQCKGQATGIATGTDDYGFSIDTSGFVVAVNELEATPHITSRMVVVSDGNMFESLEYEDYLIWLNLYMLAGNSTIVSRVDTDKFAVNMLEWLTPQFGNTPPKIDYASVEPNALKPGEKASVDLVVSDAENDDFTVTVAVKKPDDTWDNVTVSPVGGHWLRDFTADLVGTHKVYVVATDEYGASTVMPIETVNVINNPPTITSVSISPSEVIQGENVFITIGVEDPEDITPTTINVTITAPNGTTYNYAFTNTKFADVVFDTTDMSEGVYTIHVTAKDSQGAETTANIGSINVINNPPTISLTAISPHKVIQGENVFITIGVEDPEDITPTTINVTITAPNGTYTYTFTNARFANVVFDTTDMSEGVYTIHVTAKDSQGAETTANIGAFEVYFAPMVLPVKEIGLGVGIAALAAVIFIAWMLWRRSRGLTPTPKGT